MAQVTGKKVATTPMPTPTGTSGAIIDSFNTQDDKTVNAPSIHIVEDALNTINTNLNNYQLKAKVIELTGTTDAKGRLIDNAGIGANKIPLFAWRPNTSNIVNIYRYYNTSTSVNTINCKIIDSENGTNIANTSVTIKLAYIDTNLI